MKNLQIEIDEESERSRKNNLDEIPIIKDEIIPSEEEQQQEAVSRLPIDVTEQKEQGDESGEISMERIFNREISKIRSAMAVCYLIISIGALFFLAEAYVLIFTNTLCSLAVRVWFILKLANDSLGLGLGITELLQFRKDLTTAKQQAEYSQFDGNDSLVPESSPPLFYYRNFLTLPSFLKRIYLVIFSMPSISPK